MGLIGGCIAGAVFVCGSALPLTEERYRKLAQQRPTLAALEGADLCRGQPARELRIERRCPLAVEIDNVMHQCTHTIRLFRLVIIIIRIIVILS